MWDSIESTWNFIDHAIQKLAEHNILVRSWAREGKKDQERINRYLISVNTSSSSYAYIAVQNTFPIKQKQKQKRIL